MLQQPKTCRCFYPDGTNEAIHGNRHKGVCPVAFLGWKSAVLLKWENQGVCSPETALPPGVRGTRVTSRPRRAALCKSFVRNRRLVGKGTVLRSRMVQTTTAHPHLKLRLFLPILGPPPFTSAWPGGAQRSPPPERPL